MQGGRRRQASQHGYYTTYVQTASDSEALDMESGPGSPFSSLHTPGQGYVVGRPAPLLLHATPYLLCMYICTYIHKYQSACGDGPVITRYCCRITLSRYLARYNLLGENDEEEGMAKKGEKITNRERERGLLRIGTDGNPWVAHLHSWVSLYVCT